MLSIDDATIIVKRNYPLGMIQQSIDYYGFYIFQVFTEDPDEGDQDPFFSVNKETGEFKEFSILTDGNISEISRLFLENNGR